MPGPLARAAGTTSGPPHRLARPFTHPAWDPASLASTRGPLLKLARRLTSMHDAFGCREQTDPTAHLLGTAAGWDGLPDGQAMEPHHLALPARA